MRTLLAALSLAAATTTVATAPAEASVILDTGVELPFDVGPAVGTTQWLAVGFEVTRPTVVTDVETYLFTFGGDAQLTFVLRDDDAGPGDELYSGVVGASETGAWRGLHGLSWVIPTGTYWLSFETRPGQTFDGVGGVPLTPAAYAFQQPPGTPWYVFGPDLGVTGRISGEAAVPEPATWALMILGFGLAGAALRRSPRGSKSAYEPRVGRLAWNRWKSSPGRISPRTTSPG